MALTLIMALTTTYCVPFNKTWLLRFPMTHLPKNQRISSHQVSFSEVTIHQNSVSIFLFVITYFLHLREIVHLLY